VFLQNSRFEEIVLEQAVGYAIVLHKLYTRHSARVSGMARPAGQDRIEVIDGVYIHLRDTDIWQVYFKLEGTKKAVRRSLKTNDLAQAKKLAVQEFNKAQQRQLSGKPQHVVSFEKFCEEYLANRPNHSSNTYHPDTIRRRLSPYFDTRLPDVSEITDADVLDYIQWRRNQGSEEPKAKTLNRENVVLRGLIKFAVKKGYLTRDNAPDIAPLTAEKTRRDNFTRDQLKTLIETAKARIGETKNAATREQRQLLHDWIVVLAYTGLRPGEPELLQWSDVFLDAGERHLHIRQGKTKTRDVVPLDAAVDCLKAIRSRQRSYLSTHSKKLTKIHFVFSSPDTANKDLKQVRRFRTSFNNLLKACSFSGAKDGTSLVPYSLRHSYATIRIEEGTCI